MRFIAVALSCAFTLCGCELIAYEHERAAGCEVWRAGCPILIDLRDEISGHAGVDLSDDSELDGGVPSFGLLPADSLSVPESEQTRAVSVDPPTPPSPGATPTRVIIGSGSIDTARPGTMQPHVHRVPPRILLPGGSRTGLFRSGGTRR